MEAQFLVTVQGDSAAELAAKIESIQSLARRKEPEPPQVPLPAPQPAPARGIIDVGEVSGKRGDTVAIEIRGSADVPVMGFAAAIGFESDHLEFQAVRWGPIWSEGGARPTILADTWRGRGAPSIGNAGPHVMLAIARFQIKSTAPGATGPEAGETFPPVRLAQGTLLATLVFAIKDAAPIGKAIPLLNRSLKFGKPRIVTEFMTMPEQGPSVKPELDDGQVVVTG